MFKLKLVFVKDYAPNICLALLCPGHKTKTKMLEMQKAITPVFMEFAHKYMR